MLSVHILNGPNLNLLGQREPEIYGYDTLKDIEELCLYQAKKLDIDLRFFQTNHEGELIDYVQKAIEAASGLVINPAALGHSSIGLLDALKSFPGPVAEVHLSNIYQREAFRHHSYISARADAIFCGCGSLGYAYGLDFVASRIRYGKKQLIRRAILTQANDSACDM